MYKCVSRVIPRLLGCIHYTLQLNPAPPRLVSRHLPVSLFEQLQPFWVRFHFIVQTRLVFIFFFSFFLIPADNVNTPRSAPGVAKLT